jgi:hypothetical protein
MRIDIAGRGVAAAVSGLMAARAGHHVSVELASDVPERIVAIPRATVDLIEELTGVSIAKVLPSRWLRKRYVAWDNQRFSVMPHETLAFDAQALANVISNRIEKLAPESAISPNNISRYWKLVAGGRGTSASRIIAGARHAATGWVAQLPGLDESAMLVASVPQGWLVACPHPTGGCLVAGGRSYLARRHGQGGNAWQPLGLSSPILRAGLCVHNADCSGRSCHHFRSDPRRWSWTRNPQRTVGAVSNGCNRQRCE